LKGIKIVSGEHYTCIGERKELGEVREQVSGWVNRAAVKALLSDRFNDPKIVYWTSSEEIQTSFEEQKRLAEDMIAHDGFRRLYEEKIEYDLNERLGLVLVSNLKLYEEDPVFAEKKPGFFRPNPMEFRALEEEEEKIEISELLLKAGYTQEQVVDLTTAWKKEQVDREAIENSSEEEENLRIATHLAKDLLALNEERLFQLEFSTAWDERKRWREERRKKKVHCYSSSL